MNKGNMNKGKMKQRAAEVIPLLKTIFGEGIAFESVDCYKSNEALVGISMMISGCSNVSVVYMDDMPEGASAKEIAGIAAATFQETLRTIKDHSLISPEINREAILENVVLQALGRKRNRALLREHPHTLCLNLAGVFRLPAGPYEKNTLNTVLITNRHIEAAGLTVKGGSERDGEIWRN